MTENAPTVARSRLPATATSEEKRPSQPHRVTGKLKIACDLMIYGNDKGEPLEFDVAATQAGLTVRAMRMALAKPWVRAYLRQERATLIASLAATNVRCLGELRKSSTNQMVRLHAARTIEELAGNVEPTLGPSRQRAPGVVVQIIGPAPAEPQSTGVLIDINPEPAEDEAAN